MQSRQGQRHEQKKSGNRWPWKEKLDIMMIKMKRKRTCQTQQGWRLMKEYKYLILFYLKFSCCIFLFIYFIIVCLNKPCSCARHLNEELLMKTMLGWEWDKNSNSKQEMTYTKLIKCQKMSLAYIIFCLEFEFLSHSPTMAPHWNIQVQLRTSKHIKFDISGSRIF